MTCSACHGETITLVEWVAARYYGSESPEQTIWRCAQCRHFEIVTAPEPRRVPEVVRR